jgi:hypothetical protein
MRWPRYAARLRCHIFHRGVPDIDIAFVIFGNSWWSVNQQVAMIWPPATTETTGVWPIQ